MQSSETEKAWSSEVWMTSPHSACSHRCAKHVPTGWFPASFILSKSFLALESKDRNKHQSRGFFSPLSTPSAGTSVHFLFSTYTDSSTEIRTLMRWCPRVISCQLYFILSPEPSPQKRTLTLTNHLNQSPFNSLEPRSGSFLPRTLTHTLTQTSHELNSVSFAVYLFSMLLIPPASSQANFPANSQKALVHCSTLSNFVTCN